MTCHHAWCPPPAVTATCAQWAAIMVPVTSGRRIWAGQTVGCWGRPSGRAVLGPDGEERKGWTRPAG